mgnify:CR=1 FL=1|jgi:hypothetical protein
MKLRTKIWLVSQGMLILTACIIQLTFYKGIKVGPILGTPKRAYWEIISEADPVIPEDILSLNVAPEFYDARIPPRTGEVEALNLRACRLAARQEEGLRIAFLGGLVVNLTYFVAFFGLLAYFEKTIRNAKKRKIV